MYNYKDLKAYIKCSANELECPVKGCNTIVKINTNKKKYYCEEHNLELHKSTFITCRLEDNLLDSSKEEIDLLNTIFESKRESRMTNERSEDSLTWNVFRYLEKDNNRYLKNYLLEVFNDNSEIEDIIYWSYSFKEKHQSSLLNNARTTFGEEIKHGSEPDLIIITTNTVYFIEAKFTASNKTPSNNRIADVINTPKCYISGFNNYFDKIFCKSYEEIIKLQYYELMRLWLLGNYAANITNKSFYLVNLVRQNSERHIEEEFRKCIKPDMKACFKRCTWESIYNLLVQNDCDESIKEYFELKTVGYDNGKLKKAFTIRGN